MKRLLSIVSLCILTLAASAVFQSVQADMVKVPTLNFRAVTKDSDIDNTSTYVMAVNFWNQNNGTVYNVNGVQFTTVTSADANGFTYTANGVTMNYGNKTGGDYLNNGGNSNNVGSGTLSTILKGMVYNNAQAAQGTIDLTLTGLTPGKDYTLTIYGRNWESGKTSDNRRHSFTFQSNDNGVNDSFVKTYDTTNTLTTGFVMSEDNPATYIPGLSNSSPYLIEYTFTAPESKTFKVTDKGVVANTSWHLYGMSLKEATLGQTDVPVSTDIVKNGGFEKDTYISASHTINTNNTDKHGYVSNNYPLTDWTNSNPAYAGLAPEWTDYNKTTPHCGDFIKSEQRAYLPEGSTQALFLQAYEDNKCGDASQTITLEPNTEYVLTYYSSSRTSSRNPYYKVEVDGSTVVDGVLRVNQFDKNIFTYNEIPFTSQAGDSPYETTLKFSVLKYSDADGSTDRTLLLDNVQIVKKSDYVAPTITGTKHDPTVNGWQANRWNSQATAYLSGKASDYSHAYNFGEANNVTMTINGDNTLTFLGITNNQSKQQLTGNISLFASGNSNGGSTDSYFLDANSRALAKSTTYNHDRIVLTGLEPGATYETTVLFRSFGTATSRNGTFIINGKESPLINTSDMANQNGGGLVVSFIGVADDSGVINIQVKNNNNNDTLHLSGVANRYVSAPEDAYNIPLQARFNKNNGSNIVGTTPEVALGQLASKSWVRRGFTNLNATYDQYDIKLIHNNGAAIDYNFTGDKETATAEEIVGTNYGASKITLSADIKVGNTGGTYSKNARGVGLGFFDSKIGTDNGEIGRGFAGLVLDASGNLYYYQNLTNNLNNAQFEAVAWGTDKANGGGTWRADAWTNVAIDLELIDDGMKAKITDIHVVGSSADYSALIGKVFNTTDMIGFTASSTTGNTNGYVDNVQLIVRETATPETWNQKFEQYKADYIEAAGPDLAAATSFRGANGTVIPRTDDSDGTTMDIIDTFPEKENYWQNRGMATGKWNTDGTPDDKPRFTLINNHAMTGANCGIAADWDKAEVLSMTMSVDLQMNTMTGADFNNSCRGLGMGFFMDGLEIGFDGSNEVAHGFSGIVVAPDGGLYFYDYTSQDNLNYTEPIAFDGVGDTVFDRNEWYTLTMNLEFFKDDEKNLMATLTGVSLSGSEADYSSLIGSVFSTTDLIGLISSSSRGWNDYGMFDNFSMSKTVPEPSTWALLVLGVVVLFLRKRVKN